MKVKDIIGPILLGFFLGFSIQFTANLLSFIEKYYGYEVALHSVGLFLFGINIMLLIFVILYVYVSPLISEIEQVFGVRYGKKY